MQTKLSKCPRCPLSEAPGLAGVGRTAEELQEFCMAYVDLNPIRASPVLDYLGKADQPIFSALGPVSMLRAFALSLGQCFVKGQVLGKQLWPGKA